jgi:hypothetical protein
MSKKKPEETAGREEERRPPSKAMTGKRKIKFGLGASQREIDRNLLNTKTRWQIVCILRRAAGLPYSDLPATVWREDGSISRWLIVKHRLNLDVFDLIPAAWREDTPAMVARDSHIKRHPHVGRSPLIISCVCRIFDAADGPERDNPKKLKEELYQLRYYLRDLRRRILALDHHTMEEIDVGGDLFLQWLTTNDGVEYGSEEWNRKESEEKNWQNSPYHQYPVEGVLEYMHQFEAGLTETLEDVEREIRDRKDMGQARTYAAKRVAFEVARYIYSVNGKIPGFYVEDNPRGYAKDVLEIYDLLGIPSGSFQKAGAWAIAKLKSGLSSEILQK